MVSTVRRAGEYARALEMTESQLSKRRIGCGFDTHYLHHMGSLQCAVDNGALPNGGMIREATTLLRRHAESGVVFVGDSADDQQAAARFSGLTFRWANEFFGEE